LDLFPARKGDGTCMMFIHGGYWRSLDKQDFAFLAPAWVDAGVSLAVVNYDLCPKVTMEEIVRQMLRASRWLWLHAEQYGMDQDRLYVCGHSAGGHLTAMMMSALWPVFDARLPKDLWKGGLAVSGLYDLRPLPHLDFLQPDLRLDEAAALRLSPAFLPPARARYRQLPPGRRAVFSRKCPGVDRAGARRLALLRRARQSPLQPVPRFFGYGSLQGVVGPRRRPGILRGQGRAACRLRPRG